MFDRGVFDSGVPLIFDSGVLLLMLDSGVPLPMFDRAIRKQNKIKKKNNLERVRARTRASAHVRAGSLTYLCQRIAALISDSGAPLLPVLHVCDVYVFRRVCAAKCPIRFIRHF